jgi:hypothetical protein
VIEIALVGAAAKEPHPTEFPLCLFTGNDQRGFILQPGDAT